MTPTTTAPFPLDQRVTVGHNTDIGQVTIVFGDPLAPMPLFVTFTPAQARRLVQDLERAIRAVERS